MPEEAILNTPELDREDSPTGTVAPRERSTIEFPYLDLADAEGIAKAVHNIGGTGCLIEQLAGHLKVVTNGGGFRLRLLTARLFGLLEYDRARISLTPLGQKFCDQRQEAASRVEAFLTIPLYAKIYEQFRGIVLPGSAGLENAMVTLGVAPKQKVKARQAFYRSATQAGFFAHGNDRLVLPAVRADGGNGTVEVEAHTKPEDDSGTSRDGGGIKSGGGGGYHPFIEGLLTMLPEPGKAWPVEARKKWLQTASNIFDLMYSDPGDGGTTLRIELDKDSAR